MALPTDEMEIINIAKAMDEQKKQKLELKYKIAAALSTLLIGGTAMSSAVASVDDTTVVPDTTVETTMDNSEANLHEETAKLFAQKLNAETGIDEGFVSVAKEEKLSQVDPVSIYLIQQQNSETGKWETKEIKVNGKFDARPQGTPGTKIVCAGEYGNKDDMFSVYSKETRADINSPWVSTGEYTITLTKPTDNETTRYIIEGINPYAKTMEPSFVESNVNVASLPVGDQLPYEENVPTNQQTENSFVSTPKEDLIVTKKEESNQFDNQDFNDIKNEIIGEGVVIK